MYKCTGIMKVSFYYSKGVVPGYIIPKIVIEGKAFLIKRVIFIFEINLFHRQKNKYIYI